MTAVAKPISRDDIEGKFRELKGEVDGATQHATTYLVAVGAAVAVGLVGLAYVMGRRRGRKRTTIVEVRRL